MKDRIKKLLLQKFRINYDTSEELFNEGLLSERGCIKFLIKHEYHDLMSKDGHISAKIELAERYFITTTTVADYIYR